MSETEPADTADRGGSFARRTGISILLYRDRGTTWLAGLFGLLIVTIVASLFLFTFARTEAVRGYVSASSGLSRLDARAAGIVRDIDVRQGDTVKAGQRLMRLSLRETTTGGVSTVGANVQGMKDRRANLLEDRTRLTAYLQSARGDRDEISANVANVVRALDEQEATLRTSLKQQDDNVRRVRDYLGQGYATRDALNTQQRVSLDYARQISELRAKRAELRQQTSERLRTDRSSVTEKEAQLSAVQSELSQIEPQLAGLGAQSQLDIVAPVAGQVVGLFVEAGSSVAADQVLTIIGDPGAEPIVVLDVPASAIGLAKVGQDVVLKYDAFPFKTFGVSHGTITAISGSPMRPAGSGGAATAPPDSRAPQQSTFRADVRPESRLMRAYGNDEPIRIGSTLTADIVVERRRLIDWVLDPIRALRGRG